jgi:cytoskeletal protein CcmA (bactofilin family)
MAISGFGRGKGESPSQATTSTSSSTSSGSFGNLTAFIDQGSEFEGKLSFKDTVRIDGTFRGEITSENTLIVGETGEIHAVIQSTCVVVSGHIVGDIVATEQVVLHKPAIIEGDITTPSLVMEEGAMLDGRVIMKDRGAKGASGASLTPIQGGNGTSNEPSQVQQNQPGNKHQANGGHKKK